MSTTFLHAAIVCVALGACAQLPRTAFRPMPAPPDGSDTLLAGDRSWQTVRVSDAYGSFEMRLPMLRLARTEGSPALVIDSIALQQVEKRMTSRIARIARAEAAALRGDTTTRAATRNPVPAIQPGLLGTITFEADTLSPSATAAQRIAAIARIARDIPDPLEIAASIDAVGPVMLDAALVRARQVYLAMIAAEPTLANRAVRFTIQSRAGAPGSRPPTTVSVFSRSER